jgi:uncharacterized membrane protein
VKTFEENLTEVSRGWVEAGVISEPQRAGILALHPAAEQRQSRFVAILATVGGLLLAVGVSLIVKSNWEALGDWVKIGGLVTLMLGAYGAGWQLKGAGGYPKTGDMALMVGSLLFLVGIALVSQIFHLNARPASGLMIWWLGIAAVPWLMHSKGAQFASLVALLVWIGAEMGTRGSWIEISRKNEIAYVAAYFFLGLAVWLAGLGLRGTRWNEFAGLHEKWGLLLVGSALYWLGFVRHFYRWSGHSGNLWEQPAMMVVSGVLLAGAGFAAWRQSRRELMILAPWMGLALVPVAALSVGVDLQDNGWLLSAASWVALFALSVAVIRVGIETAREGWVNLGVLMIAVNIVTRYFDLFGTMLEGGVFFILTGALVIALGIFLERKRRALLGKMRKEGGV